MSSAHAGLSTAYLEQQSRDGWWPYVAHHEPSTEATAWCAIACRKNSTLAAKTLENFVDSQNKDGGWSTGPNIKPSDWNSGLVLIAMQILKDECARQPTCTSIVAKATASIQDGIAHLLKSRSELLTGATSTSLFLVMGPDFDYPHGWPWSPDTFHWIEPTSYAALAIKMNSLSTNKRYLLAIKEAHEYFLAKACQPAGWNYGATRALGSRLPWQAVPTAWALIAMRGLTNKVIDEAIQLLEEDHNQLTQTIQAQALTILALDMHGLDVSKRIDALACHFGEHKLPADNLYLAALAKIAIDIPSSGNPLKLKPTA